MTTHRQRHKYRDQKTIIFSRVLGGFLTRLHRKPREEGKQSTGAQKIQWRNFPEIADFCHLSWSNVSWNKLLRFCWFRRSPYQTIWESWGQKENLRRSFRGFRGEGLVAADFCPAFVVEHAPMLLKQAERDVLKGAAHWRYPNRPEIITLKILKTTFNVTVMSCIAKLFRFRILNVNKESCNLRVAAKILWCKAKVFKPKHFCNKEDVWNAELGGHFGAEKKFSPPPCKIPICRRPPPDPLAPLLEPPPPSWDFQ